MRALIIDERTRTILRNLAAFASRNKIPLEDVKKMMSGELAPIGDNPAYVAKIPVGYRVVFSIEQQPAGDVKHLSVSVDAPDKLPNPQAVQQIMDMTGFTKKVEQCECRTEPFGEGREAISVWEVTNDILQFNTKDYG